MQAKRRSGINPLAYLGVDPITPPMLIVEQRDPTDNDYSEYELGAIWMVSNPTKIWMMVDKDPGAVNKWVQIYPGDGSGTNFFKTDDGNTAVQVGGLLNVFGTNDVATYASGNTVTIGLENDVRIVSSLAITPILDSVLATDATGVVYGVQGTDKQFMMWAAPGGPAFRSATSDDGTVNIEWSTLIPGAISFTAIGGGGGGFGGLIDQLGNTAVPALNKVTTIGDATNITTSASGSTLTITLADVITLPRTNGAGSQGIIKLGTLPFISNFGTDNTFLGEGSGNYTLTPAASTGNTAVGTGAMNDLTTSPNNTGVGVGSLTAVAGGIGANTALGALSGASIVDGNNNVCLGSEAGTNYTSESNNIVISNDGVALDSGVIRIGLEGTHVHNYQGGIYNAGIGATNGVVSVDNSGKLGSSNGTNGQVLIGGGTGPVWATLTSSDSSIIFTPGANQLDMVAVGGGGSSGVIKLGADSGTPALPLLGEIDLYGGANIGTVTAPNAVVISLDDWISLPATNAAATAGGISINSIPFMHAMGTQNTFLGGNAGNLALTVAYADENVGIGFDCLKNLTRAQRNVFIGKEAGYNVKSGNGYNVGIGYQALYTSSTINSSGAGYNVAIGGSCLNSATTLERSVFIGYLAGDSALTGSGNTVIGYGALGAATSPTNIIAIGGNAGDNVTSGDDCIYIGASGCATGGSNIHIGGVAATTSESATIRIGNPTYQTAAYMSGIYNSPILSGAPVVVDSTGKLGVSSTSSSSKVYPAAGTVYGGTGTATVPNWLTLRSTNSTITIDPSVAGYIDLKYGSVSTCAFHAIQSSDVSNVTGDGTLYNLGTLRIFTEIYDRGSNFYPGNGTTLKAQFTAPQTGLYLFIVTVLVTNLPVASTTRVDPINIVTSNRSYSLINPVMSYTNDLARQTVTFTAIADMDTSDIAYFQYGLTTAVGTKTVGIGGSYTTVSGYLIG